MKPMHICPAIVLILTISLAQQSLSGDTIPAVKGEVTTR